MTEKLEIQFVKLNELSQLPKRNHKEDSGYDLYSPITCVIPAGKSIKINSGLQVAHITDNYWFRIESRSGLAVNHSIVAFNGIIDNLYRGELGIKLFNHGDTDYKVNLGDRIAQMVIYKLYDSDLSFTDSISETERNTNGFGSSGK